MKDIQVKVSKKTKVAVVDEYCIGNDGENLQAKLVFSFVDQFVDGVARLEYKVGNEEYYAMLTKVEDTYELPIKSIMTKEGTLDVQLIITEGIDENEVPIFKSCVFNLYCNSSINAEIEQPEEYPSWMDAANTKLNQMDNLDIDIQDSIVTITRKDGTTKVEDVRGEKGEKGDAGSVKFIIANELPTENIDDSAIYMIPAGATSEGNTYEEYIYVNGVWESLGSASVNVDLADYVKNTDYASEEKTGVVKIKNSYGIQISPTYHTLQIVPANNAVIDNRTSSFKPITPLYLDYAVGTVKASETQSGTAKMWISENEDGEMGLNISTEV